MKHPVFATIAATAALAIAAGCSDDTVTNPRDPWAPPLVKPTSPAAVLHNLEQAFSHRRAAWLDSLLYDGEANGDLENFSFGTYSPPTDRDRRALLEWAEDFLLYPGTESARLSIAHRAFARRPDGAFTVSADSFVTRLAVRDSVSGDLTEVVARGYGGNLAFKVQRVDAAGDSLWRIREWRYGGRWPDRLPVQKPRTTPQNVLFNLEQAYRFRKAAWYDSLLYDGAAAGDANRFRFWFWDNDVQQGVVTEPSWGRDGEMGAARRMFGSASVTSVDAQMLGAVPMPMIEPGHEDEVRFEVRGVNVTVFSRPQGGDDELIYLVDSNLATFDFKVQHVAPGGEPCWRIVTWRDGGRGVAGVGPADAGLSSAAPAGALITQGSWGRLKWRYLAPGVEITP